MVAPDLTEDILESLKEYKEIVFLLFYVNWCPFSKLLIPKFGEAASMIKSEFPQSVNNIAFGRVNCEKEKFLGQIYEICHYPKFLLIRNGQVSKVNYKGNRTVESMVEYFKREMEDPIKELQDFSDLGILDPKKRLYIGYFYSKYVPEYEVFRRAASNFKFYCHFQAVFDEKVINISPLGESGIILYPDITLCSEKYEKFTGSLLNYNEVNEWMFETHVPLVRKISITFENQSDFIMENLPMLILFHKTLDKKSVDHYIEFCESNFQDLKHNLLILTSDDEKYAKQLRLFGKDDSNLPLILYKRTNGHSYLFGNIKDMEVSGKLKQFVNNLVWNIITDNGNAPNLTEKTFNSIVASNRVVFIMFYDERNFDDAYEDVPMFNEVAKTINAEAEMIFVGKVNINKEEKLRNQFRNCYHSKFILFRNGQQMERCFTGSKTVEKLVKFIKEEIDDPVKEFKDNDDFGTIDHTKRMFIGYFDNKDMLEYDIFRRVAKVNKNVCNFYAGFGEVVAKKHSLKLPKVVLQMNITLQIQEDKTYTGSLLHYTEFSNWVSENNAPLVRKTNISYGNQEDFYIEKLPLLVLFYKTGNEELVYRYTKFCESNLRHFKRKLIIITSDDEQYASKLFYNKQIEPEIPFIGLVFPDSSEQIKFNNIQEMEVPGKLESFISYNIDDLGFGLFS